jgi:threonine dehydrogenase-like Zn-dependent dehydrogenase
MSGRWSGFSQWCSIMQMWITASTEQSMSAIVRITSRATEKRVFEGMGHHPKALPEALKMCAENARTAAVGS